MKIKSLRGLTALLGTTLFLTHGMVCAAEPWSGFYAGVNGGRGTTDTEEIDSRLGRFKGDGSGALAGIQLGYNYRLSPAFVVGFENSFAGTRIRADGAGALAPQVKIPLLASGRIRGGSLMFNERLFLYGTGGVAAGRLDDAGAKTGKYGWVAGAGTEWAWSPVLSTNVEVLAYNLSKDWNKGGGPSTDLKFKTVTFGFNYHF
jgi:outer membrane immunogenic protein